MTNDFEKLLQEAKEEQIKKAEKEIMNDFLTTFYKLHKKYLGDAQGEKKVA